MTKELLIDCPTGLAGDMLLAAFLDLGVPEDFLERDINLLGLEKLVRINRFEDKSYGLRGLKFSLEIDGSNDFDRSWRGIRTFIINSSLPDLTRINVLAVFQELAQAESVVHGCKMDDVHFHEIGSIETLINIVGVCSSIAYLKPSHIYCTSPPIGSGNVKTAHGILPVPVPTVLEIARKKQIPLAGGDKFPHGELTTPSGIALMSILADAFEQPSCFEILSCGVGLGNRDLGRANILRVSEIRNSLKNDFTKSSEGLAWQELVLQETWIDDVSPEDLAELTNQLRGAGALEVATNSIQMKKGRQGANVKAIVSFELAQKVRLTWFTKSTTLGLRESSFGRWVLPRRLGSCITSLGKVQVKQVRRPDGTFTIKPEHKDLIRISNETGTSLDEVRKEVILSLENFTPEEDWIF